MGYELLIRPRHVDKPLQPTEVAARLERAAREGIGTRPECQPALEASSGVAETAPSEAPAAPAQGTAGTAPAEGPWSLPNGKARLAARIYRPDGELRGLDLEIPLGGSELELRDAVDFVLRCTEDWSGMAFDPQLGRELCRASVDEVVGKWREAQAYAANVSGAFDDPRGMVELQAPPPAISPHTKVGLLIGVGFLLVYWILGAAIEALAQ